MNKYRARFVALALAAAIASLVLAVPSCRKGEKGGRLKVAASIVPLADFCKNVGGDLVEVRVMVPPGASPHTFEPTTGQMEFLSEARVFVMNGLDLETWATDVVGKVGNRDLEKVVAGRAVPKARLLAAVEHDGKELYDPHVWLDPALAACEVKAISEGFVKADPAHEATYEKNAAEYVKELEALDGEIMAETSGFTSRRFVALHPAWTYFAARYGLEQAGVVEELPGKEPSAREISRLVDKVRRLGIKVVFAEPQFSRKAAEVVARESGGGVVVKVLDPIGDPDDPEVSTYLKLMRHDLKVMEGVMR